MNGLAAVAAEQAGLASAWHLLAAAAVLAVLLALLRAAAWARVRRRPAGLPSPARAPLLVAAGCGAALLAALTGAVLRAPGTVTALDDAASALLAPYRAPWLLTAFVWFTTLGTGAALFGVAVTATGFLRAAGRGKLILPLWVTFVGAHATVWIGKHAVGRARPTFLEGVATAASPSFPSAHATGSAAVFGFVAYAIAGGLSARRERFEVAFWAAVLVALIGFSRVFLNVHFAADVVGGFFVGGSWLLLGVALATARGGGRTAPLSR